LQILQIWPRSKNIRKLQLFAVFFFCRKLQFLGSDFFLGSCRNLQIWPSLPFIFDRVSNIKADLESLAKPDSVFSPAVEAALLKYGAASVPIVRGIFRKSAQRGFDYLVKKMKDAAPQWTLYKQLRVLNPANIPEMNPSIESYPLLGLEQSIHGSDWCTYFRIEGMSCETPEVLRRFWGNRPGPLAESAREFVGLPVTGGDVERSFSFAG